ncbi:RCC1-like domain-containing protein [Archangium lipolyticum]|uniref:RCC1-like domain-containing protein n=1 Tax=Archangium lipolyticum TaxID=2970465 RepID=UPI00214A577E|nr:RCC1 domain-containing protein [Archangium lipolyticum]
MTRRTTTWMKWVGGAGLVLAVACGPQEGPLAPEGTRPDSQLMALSAMASPDATLRVPRCQGGVSDCDSGTLLQGRAGVGPEQNAPNTLGGTCADGTAGSYRADESVEQVRVATVDGSTLAAGKQVRVEVVVWAYSGYSSDALDIYYTADATQPSWTFLTTMVPTGAGLQRLSATYTLPSGGATQAVRASFRYGGSAATCTQGSFDDRDDLAFDVGGQAPPPPPPPVTPSPRLLKLDASGGHALHVRADGTVWGWGYNHHGQLGPATSEPRVRSPVKVTGLSGVTSVAAGGAYSLALRQDGTVWSWGYNSNGQLGDGTLVNRSTPAQVSGLSGVVSVTAGNGFALALRDDGTVWSWGEGYSGQLGNGTTGQRSTPDQVPGLSRVVAVAAGYGYALALRDDGTVWSWGENFEGQLGDGTTTQRSTPAQVVGLSGITALAAGDAHSLALRNDGTVWSWGYNYSGQLGDASNTQRLTPVQVQGLTGATVLTAGGQSSLALRGDGSVWLWGNNTCRDDSSDSKSHTVPEQVPGLTGGVDVSSADCSSLVLDSSGRVWVWGANYNGLLADGSDFEPGPVQVLASGFKDISVGRTHTLALRDDGTVWSWGDNYSGQLGDGTTSNRLAPVQVLGLTGVTAVSAGNHHSLALRQDGTVWSWGYKVGGGNSSFPTQVPGLTGMTAVSAGSAHALALRQDGTVWAWGWNADAQLGDGTTVDRPAPVQVPGLTGVISVSAGYAHSLAVRNDGSVWGWGWSNRNQLGIGPTSARNQPSPVRMAAVTNATAVAAGHDYSIVVAGSSNTLWACGQNNYGNLGDGTTNSRATPVQVPGLSGVASVTDLDEDHTLAVSGDGTLWAWGSNSSGALGLGTLTQSRSLSPVQVALTGVRRAGTGLGFSVAVKTDGSVWSWGSNSFEVLGTGRSILRRAPGLVPLP